MLVVFVMETQVVSTAMVFVWIFIWKFQGICFGQSTNCSTPRGVSYLFIYFNPTDYYVSLTGAVGNDGSINSPILGIQNAINRARHGDVIILMNGVYSSTSDSNLNLLGKKLTIKSQFDNPTSVIVSCQGRPGFSMTSMIYPFESRVSTIVRVFIFSSFM